MERIEIDLCDEFPSERIVIDLCDEFPSKRIVIDLCDDSDLEERDIYSPISGNHLPSSPAYSLNSPISRAEIRGHGMFEEEEDERDIYSPISGNRLPSSPAYSLNSPISRAEIRGYGMFEEEKDEQGADRESSPGFSPKSPGYFPWEPLELPWPAYGLEAGSDGNGGEPSEKKKGTRKKETRKKRIDVDPALCVSSKRERKCPKYFAA